MGLSDRLRGISIYFYIIWFPGTSVSRISRPKLDIDG
jgi:hypothetical protein